MSLVQVKGFEEKTNETHRWNKGKYRTKREGTNMYVTYAINQNMSMYMKLNTNAPISL